MEINQNHSNSKVTTSFSRREKQGEGFTFTIITATFNAAHTLERTLQSVAQQTFRNVEHIIMDGGSTDSTLAIAKAYQQHIHFADGQSFREYLLLEIPHMAHRKPMPQRWC